MKKFSWNYFWKLIVNITTVNTIIVFIEKWLWIKYDTELSWMVLMKQFKRIVNLFFVTFHLNLHTLIKFYLSHTRIL